MEYMYLIPRGAEPFNYAMDYDDDEYNDDFYDDPSDVDEEPYDDYNRDGASYIDNDEYEDYDVAGSKTSLSFKSIVLCKQAGYA